MESPRLLRMVRGVIAGIADRVAVGVFIWFKQPGNWYATLYPLALLPAADDAAGWLDPEVGARIWRAVVRPTEDGPAVTLGLYGELIALPGWSIPRHGPSDRALEEPSEALDVAWLVANGRPDARAAAGVLAWLDEIIERARERGDVRMAFERTAVPVDLTWAAVEWGSVAWGGGAHARAGSIETQAW